MQIAIIKDNKVEKIGEHRELFKNVAFPKSGPPADWMTENSVMPVTMSRSYDRMTQKSTSVDPYIEDNVVYLHKIESLTDSEKTAAQTEVDNQTAFRNREERNRRLAETDYMALSDVTMSNDWKTYRQALRDITTHSNWPALKVGNMDGSGDNDWPVKPSQELDMAVYTNDLRLKEITTGDESGTWGTSTNTNLSLIAEALSFATEAVFDSDADKTTTVADGATDPARALYYKVTGSGTLSATRTLTIAPNTISRVMFIENATTGSQSINISQGSGANITIASGTAKVVYLDGAGSGAAVVDALTLVDTFVKPSTNVSFTRINVTAAGEIRLEDSSGGEYVSLKAPSTVSSNVSFTLPDADGSSGQVLKTDGSGNLGFVSINTPGAAASFTQVDITAEGDLRLQDASGGEYVALEAPATISSSYTLELPAADGSNGQALLTNGSGVLSFGAASGTTPASDIIAISAVDGATYSVSGLSFQPSLIVFQAFGGATVTTGAGYFASSHGFATGTGSSQKVMSSRILNSPAVEYGIVTNTGYCYWINNYDGSMNFGSVTAIASDGFTVTAVTTYGTTATLMYTAYP